MDDPIPEEALVVRGGRNQAIDLHRGMGVHPSGVPGFSVECADDTSISGLAAKLPHSFIGVTTVGAIRAAGGDVIRTTGRSPFHATVTGLTPDIASQLFTPVVPNPAKLG